jgi:hypothetical protein
MPQFSLDVLLPKENINWGYQSHPEMTFPKKLLSVNFMFTFSAMPSTPSMGSVFPGTFLPKLEIHEQ